jgi:hypothetical protein
MVLVLDYLWNDEEGGSMNNTLDRNGFVSEDTPPQRTAEHEGGLTMTESTAMNGVQDKTKSAKAAPSKERLALKQFTETVTSRINELARELYELNTLICETLIPLQVEALARELETNMKTLSQSDLHQLVEALLKNQSRCLGCAALQLGIDLDNIHVDQICKELATMNVEYDFCDRCSESWTTYDYSWCSKWLVDGAETIDAMIECLQAEINELREMKEAGVELDGPVDDGHARLITDDPEVAEKFGFDEVKFDDDDALDEDEVFGEEVDDS